MTLEDYEALLEAQDGVCAICRTVRPEFRGGRLFVDHCHETEAVRGLLCHPCNSGIGMLDDSIERLTAALAYLKQHATAEAPANRSSG